MIFLSTLLRQSIYDNENHRVGVLRDVCVALHETFPVVTALVIHPSLGSQDIIIPWAYIHSIEEPKIQLTVKQAQVATYTPDPDELLLRRDILDKQIVDTQGFRVVKVNDLKLAQIKKTARLIGVDISLSGLLRRLGIESLGRVFPIQMNERTITWNYVEPIQMLKNSTGQTGQLSAVMAAPTASMGGIVPQVRLNVSHTKLADLHPADIADILEQLDVEDAGAMLERLDTETAADALNEMEYPIQSEVLSELDPERASDLLEQLPPDDAADILAEMSHEDAERLLSLMPAKDAQPIRDLLRYGAETAGGIMTNEVLALSQDATIEDALAYLRQHSEHLEMIYYLYVTDAERHLKGVLSLRQLVTAEPSTRIHALMDTDLIKVQTSTDQEEVARLIARYDLLGVPVVDNENHLVGLVTVDDVIDVIHEEQAEDFSEIAGADVEESQEEEHFSWKIVAGRFSWLAVNLVAGFLLALLIYNVFSPVLSAVTAIASVANLRLSVQSHSAFISLICFTPMLLLTSASAGSQALGVAGWRLRSTHGRDFWSGILRELQLNTTGGILSSILVALLSGLLFHSLVVSIIIAVSFGFTLLAASMCGLVLPNVLQRLRLRGSLISAPLLDPVIAVVSLSIFLGITMLLFARFLA